MVFTERPAVTGVDHASSVLSRVEIHKSPLPIPPGRFEVKIISRPSWRRAVRVARPVLGARGTLRATATVAAPNAQLHPQRCRPEHSVGTKHAGIDVPISQTFGTIQAREVKCGNARVFILEVRRTRVVVD